MPSFLDRDQLQVVQPYMAPTDAIANTFQTKLNYWAAGAAQLKSAANHYLGLDLTNEANQQKLHGYMQDVNQSLKNLSYTDLSIGDNQAQAMNIFKPITSDQNIMGDHAITESYKNEYAVAEGYRNKDNGKEYSDDNMRILQIKQNEFRNDNPDNWRFHYATRARYSPYYDYEKEKRDLMENYVPDHTLIQTATNAKGQNLPYIVTEENKSRMANDIHKYLMANMSEKAKIQMGIEGYVRTGGDTNQLAGSYLQYSVNNLHSIDVDNTTLQGKIAGTKDEAKIALYQKQLEANNKEKENIQKGMDRIASGDFSFIKQNKDAVARMIFMDQKIRSWAAGDQRIDYTRKMTGNQVWLAQFNQENENARLNATLTWQQKKFGMEFSLDNINSAIDAEKAGLSWNIDETGRLHLLSGGGTGPMKNLTETNAPEGASMLDITKGVGEIYKLQDTLDQAQAQADQHINDFISRMNGGKVMTPSELSAAREQYLKEQHDSPKQDDVYKEYVKTKQANETLSQGLNAFKAKINAKIIPLGGKEIASLPTVTLSDGKTVSAFDILNGFLAGKNDATNIYRDHDVIFQDPAKITINGKALSNDDTYKVLKAYQTVEKFYNDKVKNNDGVTKTLNNLMSDVIQQDRWYTTTNDKDKRVQSALNWSAKQFGLKPEQMHIKSFNGSDKFEVSFNDSSADFEKFLKNKNYDQTGAAFTVTKAKGSGDGAQATYIVQSDKFKPFDLTVPIVTEPYLGNNVKNALEYGLNNTEEIDIHGNGNRVRFSAVRAKDEHTPTKYEVWYGKNRLTTAEGQQDFNDFGSAWEFAGQITNQGVNSKIPKDSKDAQDFFQKYIKLHVK